MSHDAGRVCPCVAEHRPAPMEYQRHHVWPLGMGGVNADFNIAWVCPTTHVNTHEILRQLVKSGPLTWGQALALFDAPVSRYSYALAVRGYRAWLAGSAHQTIST